MRVNKELNPVAMQHLAASALDARGNSGLTAAGDTVKKGAGDADADGSVI